jgi:hypothetical protein
VPPVVNASALAVGTEKPVSVSPPKERKFALSMRMASVGTMAPAGVVRKTRRPGVAVVLTVPSTKPEICATGWKEPFAEPTNMMLPIRSPDWTIACVPTEVPRLLPR